MNEQADETATDAEAVAAEAAAKAAARRAERRRAIKRKIVESKVHGERMLNLERRIKEIDRKLDSAAVNRHSATTNPIQQQLQDLQAQETDALVDGKKPPEDIDARRAELYAQLERANFELRLECEALRRERKVLVDERERMLHDGSEPKECLEQELTTTLADPQLAAEHGACMVLREESHRFLGEAQSRLKSESDYLRRAKEEANEYAEKIQERRVRKWSVVQRLAEEALADAAANCERVRRDMINE